jgi:transmembrane sensor
MNTRFARLLEGYTAGSLNEDELREFLDHLPDQEKLLSEQILSDLEQNRFDESMDEDQKKLVLARILKKGKNGSSTRTISLPLRWAAAAAVMLLAALSSYFLWFSKPGETNKPVAVNVEQNDIKPGHEGAILVLSNGRQVVLDSAANGTVATEGQSQVVKKNGQLVYEAGGVAAEEVFHTMITPRGRQYSLLLGDGTRVWLNAESSIHFPAVFVGKERRVRVTGEVYFEVSAAQSSKSGERIPFMVEAGGMQVEVLGTRFNINAYQDEPVLKTTLLEGRVKLSAVGVPGQAAPSRTIVLRPGEQGRLTGNNLEVQEAVDLEQVIAWKNGLFHFENDDLGSILKQLQRWYDFEASYESPVNGRYSGVMKRQQNVSQVLSKIEMAGGVRFSIQQKKVIIRPEK